MGAKAFLVAPLAGSNGEVAYRACGGRLMPPCRSVAAGSTSTGAPSRHQLSSSRCRPSITAPLDARVYTAEAWPPLAVRRYSGRGMVNRTVFSDGFGDVVVDEMTVRQMG